MASPNLTIFDRLEEAGNRALDWLEQRDFVQFVGRLPNWAIWVGCVAETAIMVGAAIWWGRSSP